MPCLTWQVSQSSGGKSTYNSLETLTSAFFIINTGYKTLNPKMYYEAISTFDEVIGLNNSSRVALIWLSSFSIIVLIGCNALLILAIWLVENDKVEVLSLYSEIKVGDARLSMKKCQKLQRHLKNF